MDSTVRVCCFLGLISSKASRICIAVSERKTQSPLVWLKYQKTELPKPGATWFNAPFKDFARCVVQFSVVSVWRSS